MQKGTQFVAVSAFIPWQNKILMGKRALLDDYLPGYWEMFGGKSDFGENLYEAIIREIREEAGIAIRPIRPYFISDEMTQNGNHAVEISFYCLPESNPSVVISEEHDDFIWVGEDDFSKQTPLSKFMKRQIIEGFLFHQEYTKNSAR